MKSHCVGGVCVISILLMAVIATAQSTASPGSEAQQSQASSQDADTSAAVAAIKKLRADAGDVSTSSSQALQNLQKPDSQDSADTSAARATAFKKVQEAAAYLAASTPDPDTIKKSQDLQYRRQLDAESKTDGELFKEWLSDKLPSGLTQPDVDRPELPRFNALSDAKEDTTAFVEASAPSYTAGPNKDMTPLFTPEETEQIDDEMNQYGDAQQQYQQALQNLSNVMQNVVSKTIPNPSAVKASQRPQIKRGSPSSDCVPGGERCR